MVACRKQFHLLQGSLPFASVNDHRSLMYVSNAPSRQVTVHKPARNRLCRWEIFLRTFLFESHHIPGIDNHVCDLLSRKGCTQAIHAMDHWHRDGPKATATRAASGDPDHDGQTVGSQPLREATPACQPPEPPLGNDDNLPDLTDETDDAANSNDASGALNLPARSRNRDNSNVSASDVNNAPTCQPVRQKQQYAILMPEYPQPDAEGGPQHMDMQDVRLLPQMIGKIWPRAKQMARA